MARCDLHIHTFHSGKTDHVTLLEPMDSYSTPERVYRVAKGRGMDLVTIADHNRISGCLEFLERHPGCADFFISEEVTVPLTGYGYDLHLGVYGISESDHDEIQRRRGELDELLDYLRRRNLLHVWNHPFFQFPRGEAGRRLLAELLGRIPVFEGINSCLWPGLNRAFMDGVRAWSEPGRAILVAGSDAHSLSRIARSWTEAPGETPAEFLAAIRQGRAVIHGNTGRFIDVFGDAMGVYLGYFRDICYRNEVHRDWSTWKKIRNGTGWAAWLPVFTIGSFLFAALQFRRFRRWSDEYRRLWPAGGEGGTSTGGLADTLRSGGGSGECRDR